MPCMQGHWLSRIHRKQDPGKCLDMVCGVTFLDVEVEEQDCSARIQASRLW